MSIRLLFSDMDDTLLADDLSISPGNRLALEKAQEAGVLFCIATGRMETSVRRVLPEWLVPDAIVSCNGARVVDKGGTLLYEKQVSLHAAREAIAIAEANNVYIQAYVGESYYFSKECVHSRAYHLSSRVKGVEVGDLAGFLTAETEKLLLIGEVDEIARVAEKLRAHFAGALSVVGSKPCYAEITHPLATKGHAAQAVAKHFGISAQETLAIGDGENDIHMLTWAGVGVAVGNACEEARKAADYVARTCQADGVADAVERFCGIE